jgi:transcription elongation factor SPT6
MSIIPTSYVSLFSSVTVTHTQKAFKYLLNKPVEDLCSTHQFLNILAAEANHFMTVSITLSHDEKNNFENELASAFVSDSFSDTVNAWNAERRHVITETIEQHLMPHGAKWICESVQEEVEDLLAQRCGGLLRKVGSIHYCQRTADCFIFRGQTLCHSK